MMKTRGAMVAILLATLWSLASDAKALTLHYKGPDSVHISYDGSRRPFNGEAHIQLRLQWPDGDWSVIDEVQGGAPFHESVRMQGIRQEAGLPEGEHQYELRSRVRYSETEPWQEWQVHQSLAFTMDGTANGTLMFDEILSNATVVEVRVPEERTLTVSGELVGPEGRGTLDVDGVLQKNGDLIVNRLNVTLNNAPYALSGITASSSTFELSEGGSVNGVEGGSYVFMKEGTATATKDASMTFHKQGTAIATVNAALMFHAQGAVSGATGGSATFMQGGTADSTVSVALTFHQHGTVSDATGGSAGFRESGEVTDSAGVSVSLGADHTVTIRDSRLNGLTAPSGGVDTKVILDDVKVHGTATLRDVDVQMTGSIEFNGHLTVRGQNVNFKPTDVKFRRTTVGDVDPGNVEFRNCLFAGEVVIYGPSTAFIGCEFGDRVVLAAQTDVRFSGCLFMQHIVFAKLSGLGTGRLHWDAPFEMTPDISGNAFMGPYAFTRMREFIWNPPTVDFSESMPIGANYYGDKDGFVMTTQGWGGSFGGFLGRWRQGLGAIVTEKPHQNTSFTFAPALSESPYNRARRDTRVLPDFWMGGMISGQNTIDHYLGESPVLLKGRDNMLSLHLLTTDNQLRGARVFAMWNGEKVESVRRPSQPLHRDHALYHPMHVTVGSATFDFVLPGVDAERATGRLYLDYSGIPGFDPEANPDQPKFLREFSMEFTDPPERPLRVAVVPVSISGLIGSWGKGNPKGVVDQLDAAPAMLPIPSSLLSVDVRPTHHVRSVTGSVQLGGLGTLNWLATRFAADRAMKSRSRHFAGTAPDFYVLVLPQSFVTGYFSGVVDALDTSMDGAIFFGRSRVVMVAEHMPSAVLHELGHAVGLYTGSSRNEQYNLYPPAGRPVEGVSIVATDALNPRIRHLSSEGDFWFDGHHTHYDIMGNVNNVWTLRKTVQHFHDWFQEHLTAQNSVSSATAVQRGTRSESTRRILVSGIPAGSTLHTVSVRDVTDMDMEAMPPLAGSTLTFKAFDGQGTEVYSTTFRLEADDIFIATFDLPNSARSYRIHHTGSPWEVYFEAESTGLTSTTLTQPTPGSTIDDVFAASWTYDAPDASATSVIHHTLRYRTSPESEWQTAVLETEKTSIERSADFLPVSDALELQLVTSDGIDQVTHTMTVAVPPRPPRAPEVTLVSPRDGDVGKEDVVWTLEAIALTACGQSPADPGRWFSSQDGDLGTGQLLETTLSNGTHTLSYEVADANGLIATRQVTVDVAETVTALDLSLDEDDLQLANEMIDATGLSPELLRSGITNSFFLDVRNQGVFASARARIIMTPPSGAPTIIGEEMLALVPFETRTLRFNFDPSPEGRYLVRAELDQVVPNDPDPSNNVIEREYFSPVGIDVDSDPADGGTTWGGGLHGYGTDVRLHAYPANYHFFVGWYEQDTLVSTNEILEFTASERRFLTAVFEAEDTTGFYEGGSGTENDPFRIAGAAHLDNVRLRPDAHFRQTADISLAAFASGEGWQPIGEAIESFSGRYSGNGYAITDLYINDSSASHAGLFGFVTDAVLRDVILEAVDVTGGGLSGGLVGQAVRSSVSGCFVSGRVTGRTPGGLAGSLNQTEVIGCHSECEVRGGAGMTALGGLVASMQGGLIADSSAAGSVIADSSYTRAMGGLVGVLSGGENTRIERSFSTADLENGYTDVGGLIGLQQSGVVEDCHATGTVDGGGRVGGLVGHLEAGAIIRGYSRGLVIARHRDQWGQPLGGGLIGQRTDGVITASYFDQETSGQSDTDRGGPRTTDAMTYPHDPATYVGWDFETVWRADTDGAHNDGYPFLRAPIPVFQSYYYRIQSAAPTAILSLSPDGLLVWSNTTLGITGTIQRATAIDTERWVVIHEFTATDPVMSRNVLDPSP